MKKNTLIYLTVVAAFVAIGCTGPTQPIAAEAIRRGVAQENAIVHDLSTMAKQDAVDFGVAEAKRAAGSGSTSGAQRAVEDTANKFEKVGWLQIQHERAISLIRIGQSYVDSQKGVLDIIAEDIKTAKANADKSAKAAAAVDPTLPPNPNRSINGGIKVD